MVSHQHYDLCIIGGGINGAGIARDMAGQGFKVALIEKDDLASATSSASSKLIHGGLRYLEYYDFGLVRKALIEREVLLAIAPHIIHPLQLVLPYVPKMRPLWMIKIGLWLYDHLGGKSILPHSRILDFTKSSLGKGLLERYQKGFSYYDASVDDSRLVILNAMAAHKKGAEIITYDECVGIDAHNKQWSIRLASGRVLTANMVVNASGPWVKQLLDNNECSGNGTPDLRLVKGSHIIVPKLYEGEHAFILQEDDGRIVFAWPYFGHTAVGTTDIDVGDNPDERAEISEEETSYLLDVINKYYKKTCSKDDVISSWSGVRALADDKSKSAKAASREYKLHLQQIDDAPILSVFGGKLTTYRVLSKEAGKIICKALDQPYVEWTDDEVLPGGDIGAQGDIKSFMDEQWQKYPWLPQGLLLRYICSYGSQIDVLLAEAQNIKDLGVHFGQSLYQKEVDYLIQYEWAKTAEDILWRRSKLGLAKDDKLTDALTLYLQEKRGDDIHDQ